MEQKKVTPKKETQKREELSISPVKHETPLKQSKLRRVNPSYQSSVGSFSVFSNHITPPSGLTKFIARNPFDADLTNRLHLSVISPTVFSKVSPKSQDSPFAWTIDELAVMKPAKIDEFPIQQAHCTDPEIETRAQEAINQFFSQNSIHPSPWSEKKEPMRPLICVTPTRKIDGLITNNHTAKTTKDCWSQTVLSLPPELPKHVEDALTPYFSFTQDQNIDNDDANSSNNSLRRKLFFYHDESTDDECSFILSPVKGDSSPPQSGMFAHGTPVTKGTLALQRTYGTPHINYKNLSPPNMSPICGTPGNMSCQSIRSRCRSATRLDFSARMSVDSSFVDNDNEKKYQHENIEENEPDCEIRNKYPDEVIANNSVEMLSVFHETISSNELAGENCKMMEKLMDGVHWNKNISKENDDCKNITYTGYSEQSGTLNSNHDTGYQTSSMNNTTANSDNRSITSSRKGLNWYENINGISEIDESNVKGLSNWQQNIEIVTSSTPSKYIRHKES